MKFKNNGESVKVRLPEVGGFRWKTVRNGDIIDLSEKVGKNYGFEEFKEPEVKTDKVEEKVLKKPKSKK